MVRPVAVRDVPPLCGARLPRGADRYYVDGSLYHVGMVFEFREVEATGRLKAPWVLSKWDDVSGEVLHFWMDVPWANPRTVFQTERP